MNWTFYKKKKKSAYKKVKELELIIRIRLNKKMRGVCYFFQNWKDTMELM